MTDADRLVAAEAARDALRQELATERLQHQVHVQGRDVILTALEAERAASARLRAACQQLVEYALHKPNCELYRCTCGLEQLMRESAAVLAGDARPQPLEEKEDKEDVARVDGE